MVAVVSGNGLGLFNTSLTQLGFGLGGSSSLGQGRESQLVNIATGNLILQDQDEILTACGFNTSFLRTYNSRGSVAGAGQDGFVTGYERNVSLTGTLNSAGSTVTLKTGDGQCTVFNWNGTNYSSTDGDGAHDTLAWDAGTSTWTYTEGSTRRQEVYADHADAILQGRLIQIRDRKSDGTTPAIYDVLYNANNQVSEVRAADGAGANGDAILFFYNGAQLAAVSTREGGAIRSQLAYEYDSYGRLAAIQHDLTPGDAIGTWDATTASNNDGLRFRTTYTYVTASATDLRIASVRQGDGTISSYTYEDDGAGGYRVKTVTLGDTNTNDADGAGETVTFTYNANATDVTDSLNRTWTYRYDANKQLTQVDAPAIAGLRDTTTYQYDAAGNVTQAKSVRGPTVLSQLDYAYDGNGNLVQQWDAAGNTITRTYTASNQLASETIYTGTDPDGAGAGTASGALTTRYVYDSRDRLRFVVDRLGAVTEYTYATSGGGIGQRASARQYLGATYSGTYDEASLTAWATSTQKTSSTLVEYSYDAKGRLSQETDYATVDASGNGTLDDATSIVRYAYDAQGLLLQQVTVHGSARTLTGAAPDGSEVVDYAYDGLGRLLNVLKRNISSASLSAAPNQQTDPTGYAAWDAATLLTAFAYTDSGNKIVVTLDTGATRTDQYNAAHRLTTSTDGGLVNGSNVTRVSKNYFDAAGQLRASEDANGGRSYFFYDEKGLLSATVDATGAVVRTIYDGAGRPTQTVAYANRVDTSAWLSGSTVTRTSLVFADTAPGSLQTYEAWVDTDAAKDRNSYCTYDSAGRLATETDAANLVTTYSYDGASRLIQTSVNLLGDPAANARVTRRFYDAQGRLAAVLDAAGYLTESVYDNAGRLTTSIGYATLTNSAYWASGDLGQLRPTANDADTVTRNFYNGRNQVVAQFSVSAGTAASGQGYLTEYVYDEKQNLRAVKSYAKLLSDSATLSTLLSAANTAPVSTYRTTQNTYNALRQLATSTNEEGTVVRYSYDDAGRLVRTERGYTQPEVREDYARYDVFGNLIGEMSGEQAVSAGGAALLTMTESQLNTAYATWGTTHAYDLCGRRTESTDALGNKTWYFYDGDGRNTFTVRGQKNGATLNGKGEVIETRYDAFGAVTDTLSYTGLITIGGTQSRTDVQGQINVLSYVAATDTRRQYTYDLRGLLSSSIDATGVASTYSYTAFGQLYQEVRASATSAAVTIQHAYDKRGLETSRIDDVGAGHLQRTVGSTYDAFGRVATSTDARGVVTTYAYDRLGRQLSATHTANGVAETESMAYDAFDRVLSQTDANGKTTTYAYDDVLRTLVVTSPEGMVVTTTHSRFGQTVSVAKPGSTVTYTYDRSGNLTNTTETGSDASTYTTSYGYEAHINLLLQTTDQAGRTISYTYDAVRRVLTRIEDAGSGHLALTTTYAYDAQGRQVTVTDASGRVSAMAYDTEGRLTKLTRDPATLNLQTTYTYDAAGRQVTVTEGATTAAARTTQYAYDLLGRRTSEIVDPGAGHLALTTSYTYDANGNVATRTDELGNVTRYAYDEDNQLRFSVDALGGVTELAYDKAGNVVMSRTYAKALTGFSSVATVADVQALITAQSASNDALDQSVYRIFNGDGRVVLSVDGMGGVQTTTYDASGSECMEVRYTAAVALTTTQRNSLKAGTATVASIVGAASATDQVVYVWHSGDDRITRRIDSFGNVSETRVDGSGRTLGTYIYATAISGFSANTTLKNALASGTATEAQLTLVKDLTKDLQSFNVYDAAGRVRYTVSSAGSVVGFVYDSAGRVTETDSYVNTVTITSALWTSIGTGASTAAASVAALLTGQPTPQKQINTYDNAGRLTQVADALGNATQFRYDAAGRRIATVDARGFTSRCIYDVAGRKLYDVDQIGAVTRFYYDAAGRVSAVSRYTTAINPASLTDASDASAVASLLSGNTAVMQGYYVYDAQGQVRYSIDGLGDVVENIYDGAGRAVSSRAYSAAITITGPLSTKLLAGTAVPTDISPSASSANDRWSYNVYDADGRVVYVVSSQDATTAIVTERRYDGADQVTSEIVYGKAITSAVGTVLTQAQVASAITTAGGDQAANQRQSRSIYDVDGRLRYSIDDTGAVTEQRYNALGQVTTRNSYPTTIAASNTTEAQVTTAVASQTPRQTTYAYDLNGRVVKVTDSLSKFETYAYDAVGNRTSYTNKLGNAWTYAYDAAGRLTTETSPSVSVSRFDASGNVVVETKNLVTSTTYDATGNVLTRTENAGATDVNERRTTSYTYDARGLQTKTTFADAWTINASGTFVAVGSTTDIQVTYDAFGNAVVQKDQRGNYAYKVYDSLNRLAYDVDAAGYVTSFSYNGFGEQSGLTRYANKVGSIAGWTQGSGTPLTVAKMQGAGAIVADANNDRSITTSYDQLGRKASVVLSQVSYTNAAGNDFTGSPTTTFAYDAYGNLVKQSVLLESNPSQVWASTYNYYDKLGNKTTSVDAGGYVTTWAYDALGQLTSQTEYARAISLTGITTTSPPSLPAAGDEDVGYDRTTTYGYDAIGRKTSESMLRRFATFTGGGVQRTVTTTLGYDDVDHVISSNVDGATTTLTYDALGRVLSITEPQRDVSKASADTAFLTASNTITSSAVMDTGVSPYTTTGYDAFGNAVQVRRYANGWKSGSATIDSARDQVSITRYDRLGRVVAERQVIGSTETVANSQFTYRNYDAAGNLTRVWHARLGSVAAQNQTVQTDVSYDAIGRQLTSITTRIFSGSTVTDASDAASYNAFGEITGKAATLADLGVANKSVSYVYDKAGRMVQTNADGGITRSYGYNLAGMQRKEFHSARVNGAASATTVTTWQTVDALGRVTKMVLPAFDAAGTTATVARRFDRWGNVLEQTDPRGYATQYAYNDRNQVIRETRPMSAVMSETGVETFVRPVTEYYYDAIGQLVGVRDANGHVKQNVYDAGGKLVKSIDAIGIATLQAYDALGENTYTQDALGYVTFQAFDRLGRVSSHGDYLPDITGTARTKTTLESFVLDADGNRLTVTNALSQAQAYDFDSRGLLVRSLSAMGLLKTYEYDALGNKTKDSDASNYQTWGYAYDGRLTAHRDLGGANYTYTYSADSNQLIGQTSDRAAATTHQVTRWWQDDPNLFDDSGYSVVDTTKETFNRVTTYYANGQVKQITDDTNKLTYKYEYDAAGNRTMEETDTVDGQGLHVWVRTNITYDGQNRIVRVTCDDLLTGARNMDVSYDYDAVGNRRCVTTQTGYGPQTADIAVVNQGPELQAVMPNRNVKNGVVTTWTVSLDDYFSDPEQAGLTPTVTITGGAAAWFSSSYDSATRQLTFTTTNPATNLTRTVQVSVSDGTSSISQSFTIVTGSNIAPETLNSTTPTITLKKQQAFNFSLDASDFFTDRDVGDRLTLSLVSVSPAASWLTTTATASAPDRLWLTGTPPANASASYTVTIKATDSSGASINKTITLQVQASSAPTVVGTFPNQTVRIGEGFVVTRDLAQVFSDANGDRLNITATLTGGAPLPSWVRFEYNPGGTPPRMVFVGQTSPTASTGTYNFTVTATDTDGNTVSTAFALDLQPIPASDSGVVAGSLGNRTATAGTPWTFVVPAGTFTDATGDAITFGAARYEPPSTEYDEVTGQTIHYPARYYGLPSWLRFDPATRTFTGTPTQPEDITLVVRGADPTQVWRDSVFVLSVGAASTAAGPVITSAAADVVLDRGTYFYASSCAADANGDLVGYTARLAGGAALPSWMTLSVTDDGVWATVAGTPPVTLAPTTYNVEVVATDSGGRTTVDSFTVKVVASGGGNTVKQQSWFLYDADDRATVRGGLMTNGQIAAAGTPGAFGVAYDAVGRQVATYSGNSVQQSVYDLRGQLQLVYQNRPITLQEGTTAYWGGSIGEQRTYDAAGRLIEDREYFGTSSQNQLYPGPIGWLSHAEAYTYDADGRITQQKSYDRIKSWIVNNETNQTLAYQSGSGAALTATPLILIATTNTSYDSLGRLGTTSFVHSAWSRTEYSMSGSPTFTQTFTRTYEARDSYLEKSVTGSSTNSSYRATTSTSTYDAYGRRVEVREDTTLKDYSQTLTNLRYFSYDAELGILSRRDGTLENNAFVQKSNGQNDPWTHNHHYLYANGQMIASADESGGIDAVSGLTGYDQGGQVSAATVQGGDTLQTIAQRVYGNSSLWYVLAAANAIDNDNQLVQGMTLKVPNVEVSKNDASTFKPYNPEDIIGPTTPALPHIEKPQAMGCSAEAMIIRVVACIVAYYLGPGGYAAVIAAAGETGAETVEIDEGYRTGYSPGSIISSAASAFIPGTGTIAGVAVRAAATYVGAYAIDRAAGVEAHFSLRGLAANVATAVISAELVGTAPKDTAPASTAGTAAGAATTQTQAFNWNSVAGDALKEFGASVVRSAVGYVVQKAIVGEAHWSWASVAAQAMQDMGSRWGQEAGALAARPEPVISNNKSRPDPEKTDFSKTTFGGVTEFGGRAVARFEFGGTGAASESGESANNARSWLELSAVDSPEEKQAQLQGQLQEDIEQAQALGSHGLDVSSLQAKIQSERLQLAELDSANAQAAPSDIPSPSTQFQKSAINPGKSDPGVKGDMSIARSLEDPYTLGAQFRGVIDSSRTDSVLTTAGKLIGLLTYTRPDAAERRAIREQAEAAEAAKWSEVDQLAGSSIGAILWGIADLSGASKEAKSVALATGGLVDSAAMGAASVRGVAPDYLNARTFVPREIPRFADYTFEPVKAPFPNPEAAVRYTWGGHATAAQYEEQLARSVHSIPNELVVRWGDKIGVQGSDVISVNVVTGEVTLWDSKYRSASVAIQTSPTFSNFSRRENAVAEAIAAIRRSKSLPASIQQKAITNLQMRSFETRTVGFGNAKNSVMDRFDKLTVSEGK